MPGKEKKRLNRFVLGAAHETRRERWGVVTFQSASFLYLKKKNLRVSFFVGVVNRRKDRIRLFRGVAFHIRGETWYLGKGRIRGEELEVRES